MAMKDWLYRLQSVQLGVVLFLSVSYFSAQLLLSHMSHSLSLLTQTYHMLCNIIALGGCIYTLKQSSQNEEFTSPGKRCVGKRSTSLEDNRFFEIELEAEKAEHNSARIHNTFGWTRVDVLSMLIVCLLLASWCFSVFIEAFQTLVHLDHAGDSMHYPVYVMILGVLGLVLNLLCYFIIGGFTFHQGSFLSINQHGNVVLSTIISGEKSVTRGCKRLSRDKGVSKPIVEVEKRRQSKRELCRDMCSSVFVIICAIMVYFSEEDNSKYIDPIMAIISCTVLLYLSYPFMKESCLVLLQTIPDSIDIEVFKAELLKSFQAIINVHDLHIWQLTSNKYVSTVHIVFKDPAVFALIMQDVEDYFHRQGIGNVTIQPEFFDCSQDPDLNKTLCLVQCRELFCKEKYCCTTSDNPDDSPTSSTSPVDTQSASSNQDTQKNFAGDENTPTALAPLATSDSSVDSETIATLNVPPSINCRV